MGMPLYLAIVFLALAFAGCGSEPPDAPPTSGPPRWPSPDERTLREGHAPTPFTAAQIRTGCPSGRTSTFLVESEAQGRGFLVFRFADADAKGVSVTVEFLDEKKRPREEPRTTRKTWEQLQSHASYPTARTSVWDEVVQVPAGSWACLVYEVKDPDAGADILRRYDFARSLPGMPIRVLETRAGVVVSRQELVTDEQDAP